MRRERRRARGAVVLAVFLTAAPVPLASGQTLDQLAKLGGLASPGPLHRTHASLENVNGCLKCHEPDKTIVAARCLACHAEIRKRIEAGKGLHRTVTGTCIPCHIEHSGRDVELRPVDRMHFDHAAKTGFALEGQHALIGLSCKRCHKTHSFLTLSPACVSCHPDRHKGQFGTDCSRCHSATIPFAATRQGFDHSKMTFTLTGAHLGVRCELCHKLGVYKGLASASCGDCHRSPHARPLGPCATCHTTQGFRAGFRAGMVDHAGTAFPLTGRHEGVPCLSCHGPAAKGRPKPASCAACHAGAHRGEFRDGCTACHKEGGPVPGVPSFDHRVRTTFPLEGRHVEQPCTKCHKPLPGEPGAAAARRIVDFRGLRLACAGCHVDPHAGKLGASCEKCHDPKTFRIGAFKHPRFPDFFRGLHDPANRCEKCHKPAAAGGVRRFKATSLACASCHPDPHLGQVGSSCKPCHVPGGPKFEVVGFDHGRTRFPLADKHAGLPCDRCHRREEGTFPSGRGTAVRLTGISRECRACHKDVHQGQLGERCEKCHGAATFVVKRHLHDEVGKGGRPRDCAACHRPAVERARNPVHAAAGFTGPCEPCHRITDPAWGLGTYAHSSWPLRGVHGRAACNACHASGVYRGLPATCVSCHLEEFQRSQRPNHVEKRFSTDCGTCHKVSDADWFKVAARTP